MLKKKKYRDSPIALITTKSGVFCILSKDIVISAYFDCIDGKDTLLKVEKVILSDPYDILPNLNFHDLSKVCIKADGKEVITKDLKIIHHPKKYEKYYTLQVLGETKVVSW